MTVSALIASGQGALISYDLNRRMDNGRKNIMTVIYMTAREGLIVVTGRCDSGWHAELRLDGREVQSVAADPLRSELAYCGTFGDGAFRSDDAGVTWRLAAWSFG